MTTSVDGPVLVVDDEPMVREVLAQYLVADGFEVVESPDGEDAIEKITELAPRLVLLDLMLPKRNGLEVLRFIRQTSELPVILVTARGEESDRVQGLEAGADDYVVKPFSAREVVARVRTVLRRTNQTERPSILTSLARREVRPARRVGTKGREAGGLPPQEF